MLKNVLTIVFCLCATLGQAQEGVVTFTFDDSRIEEHSNTFPIMHRHGLQGTLFVLPAMLSRKHPEDATLYMGWDHIREMHDAGWDIQSHSYSHPDLTELSDVALFGELAYAKFLIERELGSEVTLIASPYGSFDERVLNVMRELYQAHFRAWGGNAGGNDLSEMDRYDIGRFEVKNTYTTEEVCATIARAAASGIWIVLEFHRVVQDSPGDYEVSVEFFESIVNCVVELRESGLISIKTASGVLDTFSH